MFGRFKLAIVLIVLVALLVPIAVQASPAVSPPAQNLDPIWQVLKPIAVKGGWLALVIVLDLILGVVVAIKQKRFQWQRLADFLGDYGPKVVGWLALEALNFLPAEYKLLGGVADVLATGAYGLIFISAVASVLGHVQAIGVLPINRSSLPPTTDTRGN